ncbi:hypothetical protein BJX70DRAFT_311083 [Aspergillus crustosus]
MRTPITCSITRFLLSISCLLLSNYYSPNRTRLTSHVHSITFQTTSTMPNLKEGAPLYQDLGIFSALTAIKPGSAEAPVSRF